MVGLLFQVSAGQAAMLLAFPFSWESRAGNSDQQAADFGTLYGASYNTKNLAVREVTYTGGTIEALMRSENLFHGAYFPLVLDNVLCDLNPLSCSRDLRAASPIELADLDAHVGGFALSRTSWSVAPLERLTIPDYRISNYTALTEQAVPDNWSTASFEPHPNVECSRWGEMDCADLVEKLNPTFLYQADAGHSAILPSAGYAAFIPVRGDDRSVHFDRIRSVERAEPVAFTPPAQWRFAPQWEQRLLEASPSDLLIEALGPNLPAYGQGSSFSVRTEPSFDQQEALLSLIGHPFANEMVLGPMYQQPVSILVLDNAFNPKHCDLPLSPENLEPAAGSVCGTIVPSPDPIDDHAVHIIGLITAPENGRGIVGLNPWAKVLYGRINTDMLSREDFDAISDRLIEEVGTVRVANFSWGFPTVTGNGKLGFAIEAVKRNTLVVVAAGNDGVRFPEEQCNLWPACLAQDENVLTVVGLNTDQSNPGLWMEGEHQGSNSSRRFGIGAIAQDVISTVRGDGIGPMSGTSMAVPQVVAAASLVFSAAEYAYADATAATGGKLAPKVVKDRLLYTADIFPGLQDELWSGRLNTGRAIDVTHTQLTLRGTDGPEQLAGTMIDMPGRAIACRPGGGGPDVTHNWNDIRRLVYNPDRQAFIIFKHVGADRYGELERIDSCTMVTLSPKGTIRLPDNEEVTFEMRDLLDYTSPIFP